MTMSAAAEWMRWSSSRADWANEQPSEDLVVPRDWERCGPSRFWATDDRQGCFCGGRGR